MDVINAFAAEKEYYLQSKTMLGDRLNAQRICALYNEHFLYSLY